MSIEILVFHFWNKCKLVVCPYLFQNPDGYRCLFENSRWHIDSILVWKILIMSSYLDRATDKIWYESAGESLSKALIFASTNPQYDSRLFIDLYTSSMHVKFGKIGNSKSQLLKPHIFFIKISHTKKYLLMQTLQHNRGVSGGWAGWVGPPSFWQNRRRRRAAVRPVARHITTCPPSFR